MYLGSTRSTNLLEIKIRSKLLVQKLSRSNYRWLSRLYGDKYCLKDDGVSYNASD